jgi:hypothetical protein
MVSNLISNQHFYVVERQCRRRSLKVTGAALHNNTGSASTKMIRLLLALAKKHFPKSITYSGDETAAFIYIFAHVRNLLYGNRLLS